MKVEWKVNSENWMKDLSVLTSMNVEWNVNDGARVLRDANNTETAESAWNVS